MNPDIAGAGDSRTLVQGVTALEFIMLQWFSMVVAIIAATILVLLLLVLLSYFGFFLAGLMAMLGFFVAPRFFTGARS